MEGRDHNGLGRGFSRRWEELELDLEGGKEELGHSRQGTSMDKGGSIVGIGYSKERDRLVELVWLSCRDHES